MRISQITPDIAANFANIDTGEEADMLLLREIIMPAAKKHLAEMTAMPTSDIDTKEDLAMAYLCLCAFMYDNRTMSADNPSRNYVIEELIAKYGGALI